MVAGGTLDEEGGVEGDVEEGGAVKGKDEDHNHSRLSQLLRHFLKQEMIGSSQDGQGPQLDYQVTRAMMLKAAHRLLEQYQ